MKTVLPRVEMNFSLVVTVLNRRTDGTPTKVSLMLSDLGLTRSAGYKVRELFDHSELGIYFPDDHLNLLVNPSGTSSQTFLMTSFA